LTRREAPPLPTCKTPLSIADRTGIEIDYCPTCRSVWLERGELDKIIERSVTAMPGAEASSGRDVRSDDRSSYQQHQKAGEHHDKGRRKSLLSDIFEFD
jgi:Zn-finger nucleic acid-binding protein